MLLASLKSLCCTFPPEDRGRGKGSNGFFQFPRQKVCVLKSTSFSVQGYSESRFLQKLELLPFGLHFLPLQMSFLFTLRIGVEEESKVRKDVNRETNQNYLISIIIS